MAEQLISASGTQYGAAVGEDNRLWVEASVSGTPTVNANITGSIMIGSVSAHVDSIYVQSGDNISITGMPKTEVYGSGTFAVTGEFNTGSETWVMNLKQEGFLPPKR